ncbi:hypothetical protein OG883_33630 [Streptomyces sp. NBC_01142]|uniref:hypothetical protein n=1 Tax=Streptomyces sp. NBC_01142 TaxID=2975865 RepID=UPI00225B1FFA|nr:hypothetical protein [Streptomyces sp. NBC_01142]MCX4824713.1 hypothetical protein [Streptomyces sp. NBC_01142]
MSNGPENELGGLGPLEQGSGQGFAGSLGGSLGDREGPGGGSLDGEALSGGEAALRRMLQGAVEDLAPSDGALDHLRRAVPARRARKRQALVGMAAAALLIGTAVPAFVHVASSGGSENASPVNAGHGEQAQGGTGDETGVVGGGKGTDNPSAGSKDTEKDTDGKKQEPGEEPGAGASQGTTGGTAVPPGTAAATTPVCGAAQLSVSGQSGAPDAEGKVYGTFRIVNVSQSDCAVSGAGSVGIETLGAADRAKIMVISHTAGDAAGGLPDPSQEAAGPLLLQSNAAYEVKFAWVPSETCPTTGASPDPTPTDGGSSGATSGTGTEAETQPQLGSEDGGTQDGSVLVSHTPEAGGPAAQTTISNACAGTIYRTGMLQA